MKAFSPMMLIVMVAACSLAGAAVASVTDQPAVLDISLTERGAMVGQVVDAQGVGLVEHPVVLLQENREVARATTDAEGYFHLTSLRGGVYQLVAGDNTMVVRVWAPGTAPPAAQRGVLMVAGKQAYRGQQTAASAWRFLTHPITLGVGVATAVAVPVILHNTRRSPASPN